MFLFLQNKGQSPTSTECETEMMLYCCVQDSVEFGAKISYHSSLLPGFTGLDLYNLDLIIIQLDSSIMYGKYSKLVLKCIIKQENHFSILTNFSQTFLSSHFFLFFVSLLQSYLCAVLHCESCFRQGILSIQNFIKDKLQIAIAKQKKKLEK